MTKDKLLCITPFENEEEVITIQELSIQNKLDRVSINGSVDIINQVESMPLSLNVK